MTSSRLSRSGYNDFEPYLQIALYMVILLNAVGFRLVNTLNYTARNRDDFVLYHVQPHQNLRPFLVNPGDGLKF
jgi:hypothetical protein